MYMVNPDPNSCFLPWLDELVFARQHDACLFQNFRLLNTATVARSPVPEQGFHTDNLAALTTVCPAAVRSDCL